MRRAIWEIVRLHTLATSATSDFYDEKSCNSHVCQTMQAASLTRELCRQNVRAHPLVSHRCCTPSSDAAWVDGRRDAERRSEDRMHHSGAVSDTIPRLCVKEVVSKMPLQSHNNVATTRSRTQVCDGELDARVCKHNARGQNGAKARKAKVQNTPTGRCTNFTEHDVLPQEWCAHDVAIRKVGVDLVRFRLGLLVSIAPPAVSTQQRRMGFDGCRNQFQINCRHCFNRVSIHWEVDSSEFMSTRISTLVSMLQQSLNA